LITLQRNRHRKRIRTRRTRNQHSRPRTRNIGYRRLYNNVIRRIKTARLLARHIVVAVRRVRSIRHQFHVGLDLVADGRVKSGEALADARVAVCSSDEEARGIGAALGFGREGVGEATVTAGIPASVPVVEAWVGQDVSGWNGGDARGWCGDCLGSEHCLGGSEYFGFSDYDVGCLECGLGRWDCGHNGGGGSGADDDY
jgi:hypothetical protein